MLKVYSRLPSTVQDAVVSIVGLRNRRIRQGRQFKAALAGFLERERWSEQRIAEYSRQRLKEVLEEASRTPYYSSLFRSMGAEWQELADPAAFSKIPPTRKEDVQQEPDGFRPRPRQRGDRFVRTSGTTGTSLELPVSRHVEPAQWAVWWRYRMWHQIGLGTKMAMFASAPVVPDTESQRYWRYNRPGRELRFSIYHISADTARRYVDALNQTRVEWVHGNPSAISLLASYMVDQKLALNHRIRWLTVGSENMQPWQLETIQHAFGVRPIQHYGLAEAAANISECEYGNLHVDEDFSYSEFIPSDTGDAHLLVGTPFFNRAAVLLRYHTGDLVKLSSATECPCGRWGRLVTSIDGRETDYIVLPGGKKVASLASPFHATPGLAEAQIYQDREGKLTVRYVPGQDWRDDVLPQLERRLRERIGASVPLRFQQVERVERTSRGKIKLVLSDFS